MYDLTRMQFFKAIMVSQLNTFMQTLTAD